MSVLFLDIDGVLCSSRSCVALGGMPSDFSPESVRRFDPCALGLLRQVCEETQCSIVLSSTWRLNHDWRDMKRVLELPLIGETPHGGFARTPKGEELEIANTRSAEISAWLQLNDAPDRRYAVLDDDPDAGTDHKPYFVQTDFRDGMQWRHYERLMAML